MIFDYLENNYVDHVFWIFYVLNLIFGIIAYKFGFAKKLPLLKSLIIYILLALGTFILTIFSIMQFPMTESLIIISIVMGLYRYRLYLERKNKKES
ncbi:MAG TPA: YlaH-like family protein [Bacillota bacterium]|nr:YlaH-like family protein [Bacillota bacterium]